VDFSGDAGHPYPILNWLKLQETTAMAYKLVIKNIFNSALLIIFKIKSTFNTIIFYRNKK
jgi:hypothetical protein